MKWIKAHKFLTSIIFTTLALCLIIVASFLSQGSTSPLGMQVERATAFVQRPIAALSFEIQDGFVRLRHLRAENEELWEENERLRQEINSIRMSSQDLRDLRELANIFNYDLPEHSNNVVVANVISLDGSNWFNIFTIDKGTRDGVSGNSVVINGQGLVGTVIEAGTDWSRVISTIDSTSRISFIVARDPDLVGILQGDGMGRLSGFMLDSQAGIIEGDELLTSGMGMYPRGIDIGRVTSVDYNMATQLMTITIEPSVRFNHLRKVAVII